MNLAFTLLSVLWRIVNEDLPSLLRQVMEDGTYRGDRTGTGTWSVFGAQARFRIDEGFPLLTTKKLHLRSIIHELLWFLKGETNAEYLRKQSNHLGRVGR